MALALPISHQLHASAGITALGVMLTGHSSLLHHSPALFLACSRAPSPALIPLSQLVHLSQYSSIALHSSPALNPLNPALNPLHSCPALNPLPSTPALIPCAHTLHLTPALFHPLCSSPALIPCTHLLYSSPAVIPYTDALHLTPALFHPLRSSPALNPLHSSPTLIISCTQFPCTQSPVLILCTGLGHLMHGFATCRQVLRVCK